MLDEKLNGRENNSESLGTEEVKEGGKNTQTTRTPSYLAMFEQVPVEELEQGSGSEAKWDGVNEEIEAQTKIKIKSAQCRNGENARHYQHKHTNNGNAEDARAFPAHEANPEHNY